MQFATPDAFIFFSTTVLRGSALLVILIKVLVTNMRVFMKAQ